MRKGLKRTTFIALATTLALLLGGCYFLPQEEAPLAPPLIAAAEVTYRTEAVKRGDVITQITQEATFVTAQQTDVFFTDVSGRIESIDVTVGKEVKAGDVLLTLNVGDVEKQVQQQSINVEKAKLSVERLEAQLERTRLNNQMFNDEELQARGIFDFYQLEEAKLNLKAANLTLSGLKETTKGAKLIAPVDGKITWLADIKLGDNVSIYQPMVRIIDPNNLFLEYKGNAAESFPVGAKVEITYDRQIYEGTVIANPSVLTPDSSGAVPQVTRFSVDDMEMMGGMGAKVKVVYTTAKRENAIVIPKSYITNFSGRKYVNLLVDGIKVERDVEVGLEGSTTVEIVTGLEEGDLVIVG